MDYHEFVCEGGTALFIATTNADPAAIPDAAQLCCRKWVYSRTFRLGDGTHTPALDSTIRVRVASEGYHLYIMRPC